MAEFRLPDLGEGVTEGEVVEWRIAEGERVELDQILGVVATDKATVEIPSPFAGVITAVLAREGSRIRVGEPLLRVEGVEGEAETAPPTSSSAEVASPPRAELLATGPERGGRARALPGVRRAARRRGLDLASLPGSGEQGRVRMADLADGGRRVPLRGAARAMAEQVTTAHRLVPQVTVVLEVAVERLEATVRRGAEGDELERPTLLGLLCRAVLRELQDAPIFNASVDDERLELVYHDRVQLGIAVQAEEGLRVATVRDADRLRPAQLQLELARVVRAAREGTLSATELRGSTFTVSSGGRLGGLLATPLVNWPNVATLGVHAIEERPVVVEGQVQVGRRANLSLSFDHRVIDGMAASGFLYRLRDRLERLEL